MSDYIIQKAVAPEKVVKANRLTLEEYGRTHDAVLKYDGCMACVFLYTNGESEVFSRTGEQCLSMKAQAERMAKDFAYEVQIMGGLVVVAEAWWPGKDQFAEISGAFRKKAEQRPRLQLVVNDIFTMKEFTEDCASRVAYHLRIKRGPAMQLGQGHPWFYALSKPAGEYGDPQELCNNVVAFGGFDGLVLRDPAAKWKVGSGTEGGIIKLKRVLSFDLRVLEVNTVKGAKTGRDVYKLVVDFRGNRLGVGSGLPHSLSDLPSVGDIVEVEAMDYSSDGLLREPRYKGIRYDKVAPDE